MDKEVSSTATAVLGHGRGGAFSSAGLGEEERKGYPFSKLVPALITTKPGDKWASLKRPAMYEALRRQGYSKEQAARISNATDTKEAVAQEAAKIKAEALMALLNVSEKHLGGKHDQKLHGTRGGGGPARSESFRKNQSKREASLAKSKPVVDDLHKVASQSKFGSGSHAATKPVKTSTDFAAHSFATGRSKIKPLQSKLSSSGFSKVSGNMTTAFGAAERWRNSSGVRVDLLRPDGRSSQVTVRVTTKEFVSTKAMAQTARALLESRIHRAYTVTADELYGRGYLDRDQRLKIGQRLGAFLTKFGEEVDDLGLTGITVDADDVHHIAKIKARAEKHLTHDQSSHGKRGGGSEGLREPQTSWEKGYSKARGEAKQTYGIKKANTPTKVADNDDIQYQTTRIDSKGWKQTHGSKFSSEQDWNKGGVTLRFRSKKNPVTWESSVTVELYEPDDYPGNFKSDGFNTGADVPADPRNLRRNALKGVVSARLHAYRDLAGDARNLLSAQRQWSEKHLGGKHDQKLHGQRGGSSSSGGSESAGGSKLPGTSNLSTGMQDDIKRIPGESTSQLHEGIAANEKFLARPGMAQTGFGKEVAVEQQYRKAELKRREEAAPHKVYVSPPKGWEVADGDSHQISRTWNDSKGRLTAEMYPAGSGGKQFGVRLEHWGPKGFNSSESVFALPSTAMEAIAEIQRAPSRLTRFGSG